MKVLILDEASWALAKQKIEAELHCASTAASWIRGWNRRHAKARHWDEKRVRKRHWEAIRLAKILSQ